MSVLALVPARSGSKGIVGKNFRELGGRALWKRAVDCARDAGVESTVVSSDAFTVTSCVQRGYAFRLGGPDESRWVDVTTDTPDWSVMQLPRPADLAQDDTPMIAVVQHALQQIPGQPDDIIVLLQPTQPFRKPEHIQQAITLLRESGADSVVSVVEIPKTSHALWQCEINNRGQLEPWPEKGGVEGYWFYRPTRRQALSQTYRPDGTVYVTTRESIKRCNSLFGSSVLPLLIDPADSCELDTESDWREVERRWKERHG